MKLSVPFIPDADYAGFLADCSKNLSSLYFPIEASPPFDARIKSPGASPWTPEVLGRHLAPVAGVKKYILMNTRFVSPGIYTDSPRLNRFLDRLWELDRAVGIDGIVFSDLYLASALDRTGHDIIGRLEAVPGVNLMLDTPEKVFSCLEFIETTRFAPPAASFRTAL